MVRYRTFQLRSSPSTCRCRGCSSGPSGRRRSRATTRRSCCSRPSTSASCSAPRCCSCGSASRRRSAAGSRLSWKIRYRTFLWFFSQMIKLYQARSLLYRRHILQVNIRWKALDEIYKVYMLLHRSDLNISEHFRQTFSHFSAKICKTNLFFLNSFCWFLLRFWWNFIGISQTF